MSSTTEVCFNSNCKETSEKWRRGWRRRTGEYAHLCDRCASAYEDGKFCESFHMNASGWRCCESCGKQIHCGCIVSFHMFVLLDAGGIECLTCAKKSYILTPNPAWPPPLHFLPSQTERMKDLSVKSWSAIAGSGPVPWRQAPSLFSTSSIQASVQLRMPFETDVSGGIDRCSLYERLTMTSPENQQERSYERLANGKLRLGPSGTLQNGSIGLNVKEQHCPFTSDFKPIIFPRNDSSSNQNLCIASTSKNELDGPPLSAILSNSSPIPISVGKQLCSQNGMDTSGEAQIRNGKSRGDGRRYQMLPRYRPQITDQELQQISGDSKSVITPLFEKMLSASDAGRVGRLVLPKKCAEAVLNYAYTDFGASKLSEMYNTSSLNCKNLMGLGNPLYYDSAPFSTRGLHFQLSEGFSNVAKKWETSFSSGTRLTGNWTNVSVVLLWNWVVEAPREKGAKRRFTAYFPPINHPEGLALKIQDIKGKEWVFQFRFWPNNNSRMYVLEGITPCIQSMHLHAGDVVTFSRLEPEGKLIMGGRKASAVPSLNLGDEDTVIGNESASPGDANARNRSTDVILVNGHVKEKILEDKPTMHVKRKNSNLNAKSKRLRIENNDSMELKLTYKEAQRLMRAPAEVVPSSFVVDGCEFEEFEETEPVIGRPTLTGIDHSGEKIQWVQCEDCFKWRKVPENALIHSRWTCSDNVWDRHRSLCSSTEEMTKEQLEQMLTSTDKGPSKKEESPGGDADLYVAVEGLDALANLAIEGEVEALQCFSENKTKVKHPRHRPGCACIVCLQPPSGKGTKHHQSCVCVVCNSLKRRFRTMTERRERERKQSEKETQSPSSSHNLQDQHTHENVQDTENKSIKEEEVRMSGYLEEPNAKNSSTSPLKGQIDLNIQPEKEEDISPSSDCGAMKCSKQRSLESEVIGNLLGKTMQQDGVGCVNMISCVALDGGNKETG